MRTAVCKTHFPPPAILAANKRFGQYDPEHEKIVRKMKVKEDPIARRLKTLFSKEMLPCYASNRESNDYISPLVRKAVQLTKDLVVTSRDIERFSLELSEFQHEDGFDVASGYFLSELISAGKESGYTIHTNHLTELPFGIGHGNTKDVTINGSVAGCICHFMTGGTFHVEGDVAGDMPGNGMNGGEIHIKGNADDEVGVSMKDGTIRVEGNVSDRLGCDMLGGKIYVEGNAGDVVGHSMAGGTIYLKGAAGKEVGYEMKGGEIHIEGKIRGLSSEIEHGKIYHKGKLIVDK